MVSENPRPDRCGARVVDKVGLEVHDDELDEVFVSDDRLDAVVIEKGAVTTHVEPEYDEVLPHLRDGFSVTAVVLAPSEASESDEPERVDIPDDDPFVTNHDVALQGYCERYEMHDRKRCYVHKGADPEEMKNNTLAMTHGLKAKRSNYYKNLSEDDKEFVAALVDSWIDNAPFDRDDFAKVNEVFRIAVDQLRLWEAQDHFDDGMVYEQIIGTNDEGEPIEVEDENPVNLPYDRLDRTTFRKLKDLGCLSDPDSQKAEAIESLPAKFEKLATDSE